MRTTRNMNRLDQLVRLVFGALLIYASVTLVESVIVAIPIAVFGIVNLFSAAYGYCPVYSFLGITSLSDPTAGDESAPNQSGRK